MRISKSYHPFFFSLFWGTLSAIFIQGSNFVINIILARILGEELGELTLLVTTVASLQTFCLLGLNIAATIVVAKSLNKTILKEVIRSVYIIVIIATLLVSIISVISNFQNLINLKIWSVTNNNILWFCILWLCTSSLDTIQVSVLIGLKAFKDLSVVSLLKGIITLFIIGVLVYWKHVEGAIIGYALSFGISLFFNRLFIIKRLKGKRIEQKIAFWQRKKIIFYIFKISMPIFIAAFFISPALYIASTHIYYQNNGKLYLSIFYIANQWLILLQFFPTQISKVILPLLSSKAGIKKNKIEKTGLFLSFIICFILAILSIVFNRIIIESLFKFDYDKSYIVFNVMCITAFFSTFNLYYGNAILASGKYWHRTIADIIISIGIVSMTYTFCKYSILLALPCAMLLSYIIADIYLFLIRATNKL